LNDNKSVPSATTGVLPQVESVEDPWAVLRASVAPGDEDHFCDASKLSEKGLDEDHVDEISDIEDFEAHEQHELGKTDEYALASGADIRLAECTIDVDNVDKAPSLDAEDDDRSVLFPESDDEFAEQDQIIDVDDASFPELDDEPAQLPVPPSYRAPKADSLAASAQADSTPDDTSAELLRDGSPIITLTETNCIATVGRITNGCRNSPDYYIQHSAVSRTHFAIELCRSPKDSAAAAELCIQDRSTHGTYVNQTRVESRKKVKLNNGDKIDFVNLTAWYQSEKGKKKGPPPTLTVRIPRPLESILHDAASMVVEKKEAILKHIDEVSGELERSTSMSSTHHEQDDDRSRFLRQGASSRDRSRSRSRGCYDNKSSRSLHRSSHSGLHSKPGLFNTMTGLDQKSACHNRHSGIQRRKPSRSRSPSEILQRPRDKYAPNARIP
jgi:hypothetical protein